MGKVIATGTENRENIFPCLTSPCPIGKSLRTVHYPALVRSQQGNSGVFPKSMEEKWTQRGAKHPLLSESRIDTDQTNSHLPNCRSCPYVSARVNPMNQKGQVSTPGLWAKQRGICWTEATAEPAKGAVLVHYLCSVPGTASFRQFHWWMGFRGTFSGYEHEVGESELLNLSDFT